MGLSVNGDDATIHAAMRADELLAKGDMDGADRERAALNQNRGDGPALSVDMGLDDHGLGGTVHLLGSGLGRDHLGLGEPGGIARRLEALALQERRGRTPTALVTGTKLL